MKRIFSITIVVLVCLVCSTNIQAAPKAELEQNSFNFGYAPQGSKLSHKYWIHSTGDEDLKITKVIPGCGCTKVPLEKDIVSPGDSTWMEIIFSTKKYTNKISKRPKFFTNSSATAQKVTFTTQVVKETETTFPLDIKPFKINLSGLKAESDKQTVAITNNSKQDLSISIIELDNDKFKTQIPQIIKAGETLDASVMLRTEGMLKTFYKSITIEVNDKNKTRFTIPVSYNSNAMSQK